MATSERSHATDLVPREHEQLVQIAQWQDALEALQARIAPRFMRPDVRVRAGRFLAGLLGPVERRHGWQLAEHLGERSPDADWLDFDRSAPRETLRWLWKQQERLPKLDGEA